MKPSLRPFAALALTLLFLGFAASSASAKTYSHGRTVWFHDTEISGDDVEGDLNVLFAKASCSDATISGNVNVYFGSFDQLDNCQINGTVNYLFDSSSLGMVAPWAVPGGMSSEFVGENHRLYRQIAWDIVVVFAFLLFPVRVRVALDRVERYPIISAATGTLALVAVVPVAVLLLLSIVGIPLIVLEATAIFAGLWIGQAAVALLVGRRLYELARPHATPSPLVALIFGLALISAAEILPVVGWAVTALVCLVGLGAAVLACWRDVPFAPVSSPPGGPPMNRPAETHP